MRLFNIIFLIIYLLAFSISVHANSILSDTQTSVKALSIIFKKSVLELDENKLLNIINKNKGLIFRYLGFNQTVLSETYCSNIYSDTSIIFWGLSDGNGKKINATFRDKWLPEIKDILLSYDVIGYNRIMHSGNIRNKFVPDSYFMDFTSYGKNPKYGGMDWKSLRLFFKRDKNKWRLVVIDIYHWTT